MISIQHKTTVGIMVHVALDSFCSYIGGEKNWSCVEEFQIFHTTDVEKSEILPNLEEFQNSTHDRCEDILNLPCFWL